MAWPTSSSLPDLLEAVLFASIAVASGEHIARNLKIQNHARFSSPPLRDSRSVEQTTNQFSVDCCHSVWVLDPPPERSVLFVGPCERHVVICNRVRPQTLNYLAHSPAVVSRGGSPPPPPTA